MYFLRLFSLKGWKGTFQQVYSHGHRETTTVECDGSMPGWRVDPGKYLPVNGEGVPNPDPNYQGWYYRAFDPNRGDLAWEYWRFTSRGEFEIHHFHTDGTGGPLTSPLGSPNFCCSSITPGGEACDAGNNSFNNYTKLV